MVASVLHAEVVRSSDLNAFNASPSVLRVHGQVPLRATHDLASSPNHYRPQGMRIPGHRTPRTHTLCERSIDGFAEAPAQEQPYAQHLVPAALPYDAVAYRYR